MVVKGYSFTNRLYRKQKSPSVIGTPPLHVGGTDLDAGDGLRPLHEQGVLREQQLFQRGGLSDSQRQVVGLPRTPFSLLRQPLRCAEEDDFI